MTSRRYFPVKNNKNFSWHDDGTVKDRRRPNEKHYRFFFLNIIHYRDKMLFMSLFTIRKWIDFKGKKNVFMCLQYSSLILIQFSTDYDIVTVTFTFPSVFDNTIQINFLTHNPIQFICSNCQCSFWYFIIQLLKII